MRVRRVVRAGRERHVDGVADAWLFSHLGGLTRAGKQRLSGLMNRDSKHMVAGVEGILHAVPMMGIDVHVGDAFSAQCQQAKDGDYDVVEHAETGREIGAGVMIAATRVEHRVRLSVPHGLRSHERCARGQRRRVVHAFGNRVVAPVTETVTVLAVQVLAAAECLHGLNVVAAMKRHQLEIRGNTGLDDNGVRPFEDAICLQEFIDEPQPHRPEHVILTKDVSC